MLHGGKLVVLAAGNALQLRERRGGRGTAWVSRGFGVLDTTRPQTSRRRVTDVGALRTPSRSSRRPPLRPSTSSHTTMLSRPFPSPSILALLLAAIIGYLFGKHTPPASSITIIIEPSDTASNPRHAIVDELTAAETRAVAAYVVANIPGVKTTMYPDGGSEGDYMSGTSAVELLLPDKATALAYIDGKTDTRPARYARVSVVRGSKVDVMEYKVGPLHGCDVNDCDSSYVEPGSPIVPLVADGTIPFEKRLCRHGRRDTSRPRILRLRPAQRLAARVVRPHLLGYVLSKLR